MDKKFLAWKWCEISDLHCFEAHFLGIFLREYSPVKPMPRLSRSHKILRREIDAGAQIRQRHQYGLGRRGGGRTRPTRLYHDEVCRGRYDESARARSLAHGR